MREDFDPDKHFKAWFTCPHCQEKQYYTVTKGQTWTNRESIKCCVCNITFPAHLAPEYPAARAAAAGHGLVKPDERKRDNPIEPLVRERGPHPPGV